MVTIRYRMHRHHPLILCLCSILLVITARAQDSAYAKWVDNLTSTTIKKVVKRKERIADGRFDYLFAGTALRLRYVTAWNLEEPHTASSSFTAMTAL